MKKISIVIINYNGEKNTLECLKSIEKLKVENYILEVLVIDNASLDKSAILDFKFTNDSNLRFRFIENKQNLGFSKGNNIGIHEAFREGSDYVLLLNNDTIVDKNLIEELILAVQKDKEIGIVAPKIYFEKGFEFHKERYKKDELGKVIWYAGGIMDWKNVIGRHKGVDEVDRGKYDKISDTDFATGCCMLIKKEVIKKIGLLNEKYFLYYEDNDFSTRAIRAGFRIIFVPKAVVFHKNAGSSGGSGSALQDYYITRNRLFFGLAYSSLKTKLFLIKESLLLLTRGRPWQKRGILDFYLGKFGRGSYFNNL